MVREKNEGKDEGTVISFSLPAAPPAVVLPLLQSLFIVSHGSNHPYPLVLPSPPSTSFSLFSIHTNDSVKQVKCYKLPPEAQPA